MHRIATVVALLVAAVVPVLVLADPITTPVPVPGSFETVSLRGDFDAEVREGSPAAVEIVAEPGLAERVRVETVGNELRLARKDGFESAKGVLVKVTVPSFRGMSLSGSGTGKAESGPAARDVKLAISGSGDLSWRGAASALDVAIAGSGDVKVSGTAELLKASVAGSGDVEALGLAARDAKVSIAGSGEVSLQLAGGTLDARIAGSGDVLWSGTGKLGAVSTAGSGRVRQK